MSKNIFTTSIYEPMLLHRCFLLLTLSFACQHLWAKMADCSLPLTSAQQKLICQNSGLAQLNAEVAEKYLNAQLMSNAPLKLLQVGQHAWEQFSQRCKNKTCWRHQFEQRLDDLSYITTMNQSLTQHFIRYNMDNIDTQFTQIQLLQLDKNRIKVEAMQYRNPNNQPATQIAYLRSYISPGQLTEITDLESLCKYDISRTAYALEFKARDKQCQRFDGIYKLYD